MKNVFKKITAVLMALLASMLFISADVAEDVQEKHSAHILIEARPCAVLDEYNSDLQMNAGWLSKLMSVLLI
ncbi:MAG: hypothetical protein K2J44_02910, partial [Ruminococcus sp.]|nr:hypothetical protein [Ruminococcus sp.]